MEENKALRQEVRTLRERVEQSEARAARLDKERVEAEAKKDAEIREEVGTPLTPKSALCSPHPFLPSSLACPSSNLC